MLIHTLHIEDLKFSDIACMLQAFWDPKTAITRPAANEMGTSSSDAPYHSDVDNIQVQDHVPVRSKQITIFWSTMK